MHLVHRLSSPKLIVFPVWNLLQSLKLHYKNNLYHSNSLWITPNQTFLHRKLSSKKRGTSLSAFHRISLKYSKRAEKLTRLHLTSFCLKLCGEKQNYAPLQRRASNNHTNSQSYKTINWVYLQWPIKVNRGKLALINRLWKRKKGKDRRSPLVHSRKLPEHDKFTRAVSRRYRERDQR